jgi:hypothetical protein
VDRWLALCRRSTHMVTPPTPQEAEIAGVAELKEAILTLDVFLAGYEAMPDDELARPEDDDDLLTWGQLRTIRAHLQRAQGER